MKKKGALVLAALMMTATITGCSADEKTVYEAMMKSREVLAVETELRISAKADTKEMSAQEKKDVEKLMNYINSSSITVNQKMVTDDEMTKMKTIYDLGLKVNGTDYDMDLFLESGQKQNGTQFMKQYMSLPRSLTSVNPELNGKEYLMMDFATIAQGAGTDIHTIIKETAAMDQGMTQAMEEFVKKYKFEKSIISQKKTEKASSEKGKVYEIKMDDALFKEWLKYALTLSAENNTIKGFMKAYVDHVSKFTSPNSVDDAQMREQLSKFQSKMELNTKEIETFFDFMKDVPLVGEDGIIVEFKVDSEGNLNSLTIAADLMLDMSKWSTVLNLESLAKSEAVLPVEFSLAWTMKELDEKAQLTMPNITISNTIDFADLGVDLSESAKVFVGGERVYFDVIPIIKDGHTLVPFRQIGEAMNMTVNWDSVNNIVTAEKDNMKIELKIDNTDAKVNGEIVQLNMPATIKDGRTFIPLRFISENMNQKVSWSQEQRTIEIDSKSTDGDI